MMLLQCVHHLQKSILVTCALTALACWLCGCTDYASLKKEAGKGKKLRASGNLPRCSNGEHVTLVGAGDKCSIGSVIEKCLVDVTNCATLTIDIVHSNGVVEVKDDKCKELIFNSLSNNAQVHVKAGTEITCPPNEYGAAYGGVIRMGEQYVDMRPYEEQHRSYKYDGGPDLKFCEAGQKYEMDGNGEECLIYTIMSEGEVRVRNCRKLEVETISWMGKLFIVDDKLEEFRLRGSFSSGAEIHLNPNAQIMSRIQAFDGCRIEMDGGSPGKSSSLASIREGAVPNESNATLVVHASQGSSLASIRESSLTNKSSASPKPPVDIRHAGRKLRKLSLVGMSSSPFELFLERDEPLENPQLSTGEKMADLFHQNASLSNASKSTDSMFVHNDSK